MRSLIILIVSTLMVSACASSEKNSNKEEEYPNLVNLNPPGDRAKEISNIYIDSVEIINYENGRALLISGNFPDACTYLSSASDTLANGTLKISLEAWRETDQMCAQVLTSFSYIYSNVSEEVLTDLSSVTVNDRSYPIK